MDIILFFYNLIITTLFAICAIGFLILYLDREDVRLIMISAIFAAFVADNLILYMNEFLPEFHTYYSGTLNTAPVLSNMSIFLVCYLYRRTLIFYDNHDITIKERVVWIFLFVALCIATFNYTSIIGRMACISLIYGTVVIIFALALIRILLKGPYPAYEGVPRMPLWLIVTSLTLEIGNTIERVLQQFEIEIIHGRIISIELISILYIVIAIKYIINNLTKKDSLSNNLINENKEIDDCEIIDKFVNTYKLTNREKNIFEHLIAGESIAQICDAECIAVGTVKSHTHNIYQKLEVSNRVQLITLLNEFRKSYKDNISN